MVVSDQSDIYYWLVIFYSTFMRDIKYKIANINKQLTWYNDFLYH